MTTEQEFIEKWGTDTDRANALYDLGRKAGTEHSLPAPATIEAIKGLTNMLIESKSDMREAVERLEKKIDANTELTQSVLIQATKTNGRVNGLEQFSEDTKKYIEGSISRKEQLDKDDVVDKIAIDRLKTFVNALAWWLPILIGIATTLILKYG